MTWDYFMTRIVLNGHLHETVGAYALIFLSVAVAHHALRVWTWWRGRKAQ